MLPVRFDYVIPYTLSEAAMYLQDSGKKPRIIAGGTDLVIELKERKSQPDFLLDVTGIPEMQALQMDGRKLRIGCALPFAQIAADKTVKDEATALAEAAALVGSPQIRNRGTIGGNITTGSPAADTVCPLTALEANAILYNKEGWSRIPVEELWQHAVIGRLGSDTLMVAVEMELPENRVRSTFVKLGRRNALAISRINLTLAVSEKEDGTVGWARVALGSVALHPYRIKDAETLLTGQKLREADMPSLEDTVVDTVRQTLGNRASAPYKLKAVRSMMQEAVSRLVV